MGDAPQELTITISIERSRQLEELNFNYRHKVVRALPGDMLQWNCDVPFVIHFPGRTPFRVVDIHSSQTVTVREDAAPGTYTYAVAVFVVDKVHVDTSSGTIIIERNR
jgi:hypothetical protein